MIFFLFFPTQLQSLCLPFTLKSMSESMQEDVHSLHLREQFSWHVFRQMCLTVPLFLLQRTTILFLFIPTQLQSLSFPFTIKPRSESMQDAHLPQVRGQANFIENLLHLFVIADGFLFTQLQPFLFTLFEKMLLKMNLPEKSPQFDRVEGFEVGAIEGFEVGVIEGFEVTVDTGFIVGDLEGLAEGLILLVGLFVGLMLGSELGLFVGESEGSPLGSTEG